MSDSDEYDEEKTRKEIEKYSKKIGKMSKRVQESINILAGDDYNSEDENEFNDALDDYENNEKLNAEVNQLLNDAENDYNNKNNNEEQKFYDFMGLDNKNVEDDDTDFLIEELKKRNDYNEKKSNKKNYKKSKKKYKR